MDSKAQSNGANPLISTSICLRKERTIPWRILRAQIYLSVTKYSPNVVDVKVIDRYSSSDGVNFERKEKIYASD